MTKSEAFKILNSNQPGIPFAALDYLYNLPYDGEVEQKVIFHLENAYNDRASMFMDHDLANTALWYAILAEKHGSEKIVPALLKLFTTPDTPDWDFLDEQGLYLVGKLAEDYPRTIDLFFAAIEEQVGKKSNAPYLYLYDAVYSANDQQHGARVSALLGLPHTGWRELLAVHAAEAGLLSCRADLEWMIAEHQHHNEVGTPEYQMRMELEYALGILNGENEPSVSYYRQRAPWREHYRQMTPLFEAETPMLSSVYNNIGRNDPCPCGSTKKFKNCCGKVQ